jgi:uncharacterized protein
VTGSGRPAAGRLSVIVAAAILIAVVFSTTSAIAQPAPPQLTAAVNDFAGVIDGNTTRQLEDLIQRLQAASGDVLVIATVKTFKPWPDITSYAVKMFENGGKGIGTKGKDNGALMLVALDDRQIRFEVGYGLEGFVTDGFAGETSRQTMAPFFRAGDYSGGILAGARRLAARIAQGRNVTLDLPGAEAPRGGRSRRSIPMGTWVILLIIILSIINRRGPGSGLRRGRRWSSGVGAFGAGAGWARGGGWGSSGGGFGGGGFGGFGGGRSGCGGGGGSW